MADAVVRGAGLVGPSALPPPSHAPAEVRSPDQELRLDAVSSRCTRAYLVMGSGGMLGTALQWVARERARDCLALPQSALDITDQSAVERAVALFGDSLGRGVEGVVVNAAAYTDVEGAEDDAATAYEVNEQGARNLARAARAADLRFVHVSTDFVFDGTCSHPYREDDAPNPLSVYGASKLAGEWAVAAAYPAAIVVRTAWVFGAGGNNFPLKVLHAARTRGELSVVDDETGSPTYTRDLASGILALVDEGAPGGLYHLAGEGSVTRYDLAVEVLRLARVDVPVSRARSADFVTRAARPANSVLDCSRAARCGVTLPNWRDGLSRYLQETQAAGIEM